MNMHLSGLLPDSESKVNRSPRHLIEVDWNCVGLRLDSPMIRTDNVDRVQFDLGG